MLLGHGLEIRVGGMPRQEIGACPPTLQVGLHGSDYPGLRLRAIVAPGETVARGTPVLEDRAHPAIKVTAPAAGVIDEVALGARRMLSTLTIRVNGEAALGFEQPKGVSAATLEKLLLESGLWTALLARPYGRIPPPGTRPDAIFVAAADSEPGAVDPGLAIAREGAAFDAAVAALTAMTEGAVFVCHSPGAAPLEAQGRIRHIVARRGHKGGLVGTLIDRHFPVTGGRTVWQIGWADALALGTLLSEGRLPALRTVALGGPMARDPRLVRLPWGADIEALASAEAIPGATTVFSGSALSGQPSRFLRRQHGQVTILPRQPREHYRPRRGISSGAPRRAPLIPHAALDRALGPRLPVVPLLRALSVGDAAGAGRLGARALIEEDMALASYLSGGAEDFGALLRAALDRLEAGEGVAA